MKLIDKITGPNGTVRVLWSSEDREFICKLVGKPDADYFTDDETDAKRTAELMAGYPAR